MDYGISSAFKVGVEPDDFIDVDSFEGVLPDPDYIKGAIRWRIESVHLMTDADWDILDLLWGFIVDGLLQMKIAGSFEICFPSQPLVMTIAQIDSVQSLVRIGSFERAFDSASVVSSLHCGAKDFFSRMMNLVPEKRERWEGDLRKLEQIKADYGLI